MCGCVSSLSFSLRSLSLSLSFTVGEIELNPILDSKLSPLFYLVSERWTECLVLRVRQKLGPHGVQVHGDICATSATLRMRHAHKLR